jgi:hypothetical protein
LIVGKAVEEEGEARGRGRRRRKRKKERKKKRKKLVLYPESWCENEQRQSEGLVWMEQGERKQAA